jgi:uncharacterized protein
MRTQNEMKPAWRQRVRDFIRAEALPVDKFGHQPRLAALVAELADAPELDHPADTDVLFAAAWMHDLGVFTGHRPTDPQALAQWDHVPYTLAATDRLLRQWEFPQEKLAAVTLAIQTHEARYEPTTPEGVVLRDADILEQLGAIGVARSLVKVGRDTRYHRVSDVLPVLDRALETLPARLKLAQARSMAAPRIAAMQAYLQALRSEAGCWLE